MYKINLTFDNRRYHQNEDMAQWCNDNIGKGGWIREYDDHWNVHCTFGTTTYCFYKEEDATLFALRWM
jgi:hypothetical protein